MDLNLTTAARTVFSSQDFLNNLPPELMQKVADLIFILKAIGILVIIYFCFLLITGIMNFLRNIRIKKIYKKVNEIDEKIDILLDKDKKREERFNAKQKEKLDKKDKKK